MTKGLGKNALPSKGEGAPTIAQQRMLQWLAQHDGTWFRVCGPQFCQAKGLVARGLAQERNRVVGGEKLFEVRVSSAGKVWLVERGMESP